MKSCFHLAYHVTDLDETRRFYGGILGYQEGRCTDTRVDAAKRLESAGVDFILPPTVWFSGEAGEPSTVFFRDPSGNLIEIKGLADTQGIFTT